ncbi:MAG TPA: hypothetical protein VN158_16675 [Caulobacter sp.]|nr:hypothetical protein [Caulobacter sp.]
MKTKLPRVAAVASLSLTMTAASAQPSSVTNVHVINVVPDNAGVLVFFVDATRSGAPACAAADLTAWTVNTNTMAGQTQASLLLTALSTGLRIDIGGVGTCDHLPNVEAAGFIAIHK